jgi:DNA repair protein RadC
VEIGAFCTVLLICPFANYGLSSLKLSVPYETLSNNDVLSAPDHVRRYLSLQLSGLTHDVFAALFLDNRHRVIEYKELITGTIDSAAVYPREVVKHCLGSNAAAVIMLIIIQAVWQSLQIRMFA